MTIKELEKELNDLGDLMEDAINNVSQAAEATQSSIYEYLSEYINNFEIANGRFVAGQNFSARIAAIQKKFTAIIGELYTPVISEYLHTYTTIEQINVSLQKSYNQLEIDVEKLSPARKSIVAQANYYLKEGLADAYVQPAKYLIMQQVTNGITLADAQRVLKKWNQGDLSAGSQLTSGRATPNLTKYATQVSRDSLYGYNGSINEIISNEYSLNSFIYVGDIIEDSRPFCRHLVGLKRKIKLSELPPLFKKYPEGLKPGTTMKNFYFVRGGYSCRHQAMAVRG